MERGERNLGFVNILRIAEALEVDPGDLVDGLRPKRRTAEGVARERDPRKTLGVMRSARCTSRSRPRSTRSAAATTVLMALIVGLAVTAAEPGLARMRDQWFQEAGVIVSSDLPTDWTEEPPEEDAPGEIEELSRGMADISACRSLVKQLRRFVEAEALGPIFTLDDQVIKSSTADVGKKAAKRFIAGYESGDYDDCFEQYFESFFERVPDFKVRVESEGGPDVGNGSVLQTVETSTAGATLLSQVVIVRVGGVVGNYEYMGGSNPQDQDVFAEAAIAAATRLNAGA